MITVPAAFAQSTIQREGEAGRIWIAELPERVATLLDHWHLVQDGSPMHGYLGLVLPVVRDALPLVLKVSWQDATSREEALALTTWNGQGAVQLHAEEPTQGALLLERLDHRRHLEDLPIAEAIVIAGQLFRRLAVPTAANFRQQEALVNEILAHVPARWEQVGRPFPRQLLDRTCALLHDLALPAAQLLVNYDLHYENVLAGTREPWLAVDPKVLIGDPEYGVAQLLVNRLEAIEVTGGLARHFPALVEAAALDDQRTRAWTLVRCVDYWLWGLTVGLTEDPKRCARIIDWLGYTTS